MTNKRPVQNHGIYILKIGVFVFAILLMNATAAAQTSALEQQCINDVQGKVAWNNAGNTTWSETNIRRLCQGTTNPSATIACFKEQIRQHDDWSRGITACLPKKAATNLPNKIEEEKVAVPISTIRSVRTVTLRNNSPIVANLSVRSANQPLDAKFVTSITDVNQLVTKTVEVSDDIPDGTPLQVSVDMRLPERSILIYRGLISGDNPATNFCFEAKRDAFQPLVTPCDGTKAFEAKKIEFRNESGFSATATLDYAVNGAPKSISTADTSLGVNRVLYIPTDADRNTGVKLTIKSTTANSHLLLETTIDVNSNAAECYKVYGTTFSQKANACDLSKSARTIKIKHFGGFSLLLAANYYDRNQKLQSRRSLIELAQEDVFEIPRDISTKPIALTFQKLSGNSYVPFHTATVPANFTGEVCYKWEGTVFNPNISSCDDELNAMPGVDSRQIIFKNEAGYDAQIFVQYFEMQDVSGTKVPMLKTVASGFINLGKSRIITIPQNTAANMPIRVFLQGNATLKNDIFFGTLDWDFKSSPVPCFKTWDTLFTPKGGKCN